MAQQRGDCGRLVAGLLGLTVLGACGGNSPESSNPDNPTLPEASSSEVFSSSETAPDSELAPPVADGPPPPPSAAFIALLSPEKAAEIEAMGVPLVVPTAIPAGFAVEQVMTSQSENFSSYQILYRDGGDRCFVVEFAAGGVGDIPATEYRLPIEPPLFSGGEYGLNYGGYVDSDLRAQFPEPELVSDWLIGDNGVYRLAGAAYINDALTPARPCQDITPEEAVEVVESLALVTDDIGGDG
ncbi:MAG: hypothetical protein AAFN08_18765 [Cyanobacteria bacterium J06559_3]